MFFKGPKLNTAPFLTFSRSFLPEVMLKKAGFIQEDDKPYVRSTATRTTHNEFYNITLDSMFGAPSPKLLRLDILLEALVISQAEKGRGHSLSFSDIKNISQTPGTPQHVVVSHGEYGKRTLSFTMENPDVAKEFVQKVSDILKNAGEQK